MVEVRKTMLVRSKRFRLVMFFVCLIDLGTRGRVQALEIAVEHFDYATGSLAGKNGGSGWSSAWSSSHGSFGDLVVASSSLAYTGVSTTGNRISLSSDGENQRTLSAKTDTFGNTVWVSFLGNFTQSGFGFNNVRFYNGSSVTGGIGGNGSDVSNYYPNWAILDSSLAATSFTSTPFNGSITRLAMLKIDYAAGTSSLWMDPNLSTFNGTQTPSQVRPFAPVFDKVMIYLRGGNQIDELRIATTWQESVGQPVPEPSAWILAATSLMVLGFVRVRRKSRLI
jgi:hypothetical protein